MQIVLDNIIYSLQRSGGGSVYWTELLQRFCNTKENLTFVEHVGGENNIFRNHLNLHENIILENKMPLSITRFLPLTIPIKEKSIFHSSYYRYSNSINAINILTIHDFTAEHFLSGIRRKVNYIQKKQAIKKADGIICISNHTKNDLLELHSWVDESKVRVIYNGVGNEFFPLNNANHGSLSVNLNDRPYILYIGHRTKQYKNFDLAVKTLHKLPKDFILVAVGEPFSQEEMKLIQSENLSERIQLIVKPGIKELNILYNYAYCFLYPSSYEGFGIPVIEAMKTGCPVVAVNKSSIPEVSGNAALLVENASSELFAQAIMDVDKQREHLVHKGFEQAKKFSWDNCFREVYEFYCNLYGNS